MPNVVEYTVTLPTLANTELTRTITMLGDCCVMVAGCWFTVTAVISSPDPRYWPLMVMFNMLPTVASAGETELITPAADISEWEC